MFFGTDDPEEVIRLLKAYPEFQSLYAQLYELCRNTERVMGIFSEELRELDRNTVQYMIDEMQETIDRQKAEIEEKSKMLEQYTITFEQKQRQKAITLIRQVRNITAEGISAEKCAKMLFADPEQVRAICEQLRKHPGLLDEELYEQTKHILLSS